ncbi:protein PLASTID MOVEMENT IMPAIRED 2 [Morus notabilis]|nr:protein PLASTID MOVEMENT IMPAIRED 2 [Morus notabilis]
MNRGEFDDRRRTGSVKAAIRLYGDKILNGRSSLKKPEIDVSEKSYSKTRELHMARRDIDRYKETRAEADSLKAQAEFELLDAKTTVTNLSSLLRESDSKAKAQKQEIETTLRKSTRKDKRALAFGDMETHKYSEVMKELEAVKQELRMLKLDMASVLEEKSRAEKQIEASRSKIRSHSSSLEAVKKETEEVNEEQVLVELARIEALKEYGEIEAERAKEASQFASAIEQTRRKINDIVDEVEHSKELESKLAITIADVDMLQNELQSVKEMEKRIQRNDNLKRLETSFRGGEELDSSLSLQSVTEELEAAKKELASLKAEGFQYMASMDIIRNERKHVKKETARLEEIEKKGDLAVQNLNSKLLRAKAKLEAVSAAEEKAKSIVSNLSLTLEQLKTEAKTARREKVLVCQEAATIKEEIGRTESEIDSTEERLQAAMQELEAAKSSEALALKNLKSRIENTVGARTSVLKHSSSITISNFEYEYLTGRAVGAEELADKKVAAAQAWIEAIKANEKEILMKIDFAQREIREMRLEEEREAYRMERSFSAKRTVERELQSWRTKREKNATPENLQLAMHKKSIRGNGNANLTPSRRAKFRKSASPAARNSFPVKKRTQVMPLIAKFFKGKTDKNF